jgi:GntR family transcriptional regulator
MEILQLRYIKGKERTYSVKDNPEKFRYLTIYQDIKDKIKSGEFAPGEKLKTEKEYQEIYQVSRDTVRKAFAKLKNEELIVKKTAVGSFVKYNKSNYTLTKLESFTEQMQDRGIEPLSELVSIELGKPSKEHIYKKLGMENEDKCYKITRIRKGDGNPMAYEITYVPQKICPGYAEISG